MWDSLPTELVLKILLLAAESFILSARQTAVALAQTSSLIYDIVKPILYRRLVVTRLNLYKLEPFLKNRLLLAFVRELTSGAWEWKPSAELVANFTGLQSVSGISDPVYHIIGLLPPSALENLKCIQLWDSSLRSRIPPSVTHVCLYIDDVHSDIAESGLMEWVQTVLSLTHLAIEIVAHADHDCGLSPPDNDSDPESPAQPLNQERRDFSYTVIDKLYLVLAAGGSRIEQVAVRVCGWMAEDVPWDALVTAASQKPDVRIRLWRDQRAMDSYDDDTKASLDDAFGGMDCWSESSSASEIVGL